MSDLNQPSAVGYACRICGNHHTSTTCFPLTTGIQIPPHIPNIMESVVQKLMARNEELAVRLAILTARARALVDAINATDTEDITPQVEALEKALEAKP